MSPGLPPLYTCTFCGRGIDPNLNPCYQRARGWVRHRDTRKVLALPQVEAGWACATCVEVEARRREPDTLPLF